MQREMCPTEGGSQGENIKEQVPNQGDPISCQNSVPRDYFDSDHHLGIFSTDFFFKRKVYSIVTRFCSNRRILLSLGMFYFLKFFSPWNSALKIDFIHYFHKIFLSVDIFERM